MPPTLTEIPLLGDPVKVLRREPRGWAIFYGDNFLRYLTEFEENFVNSALAASANQPSVVYNTCDKHAGQPFTSHIGYAQQNFVRVCPHCEEDD